MHSGHLADYFAGVAAKRLASVDCVGFGSNQHEVTGSRPLIAILGDEPRRQNPDGSDSRLPTLYIYIPSEGDQIEGKGVLSWYDSRANRPHRSAEWRLYYQDNDAVDRMAPGDSLFLLKLHDGQMVFIICEKGGSASASLSWLLGVSPDSDQFEPKAFTPDDPQHVGFIGYELLDRLGVEHKGATGFDVDRVLAPFGTTFPDTRTFSALARSTVTASAIDDPDGALMAWMDRETFLFRELERRDVEARIRTGFVMDSGEVDVDGFVKFSLTVQNRRKARAGYALMNHFGEVLIQNRITFQAEATTEKRKAADFLFPGEEAYHSAGFPVSRLHMVAAKTSCKDRWRQVLAEADRIAVKHLLTLEPGISPGQTMEMQEKGIQLIIPTPIQPTFLASQQPELMSISDFLTLTRSAATSAP